MTYDLSTKVKPSAIELADLFSQTTWAAKRTAESIDKMLNSLDTFVCIRYNKRLIAFGKAITDGVYRALIDDVIVDKAYQKKGLGKLVMVKLLDQLTEVDQLFLNTKPELEDFYKQFGFLEAGSFTMKK